MSLPRASLLARRPGAALPGPDLDVTPVMNMFIILIPFLVGMSAFTHLSAHVLDVPGDQSLVADAPTPPPPLVLNVATESWRLSIGGRVLSEGEFPATTPASALARLEKGRLIIAAGPALPAEDVVRCLDMARAAGFQDVGLAAAGPDADPIDSKKETP